MQTAHDLATLARDTRAGLSVIGIPKTIDNDLAGTDHAPGYGSAARFFASAASDIGADNRALPRQVREEALLIARRGGRAMIAPVQTLRLYHQTAHLMGACSDPASAMEFCGSAAALLRMLVSARITDLRVWKARSLLCVTPALNWKLASAAAVFAAVTAAAW